MPKLPHYTKEQLEKAQEEVSRGVSVRAAAKKYGVPKSTIQFKLKHPEANSDFGPVPYLNSDEEKVLEEWLIEMGKRGFPRNAEDVLDSVQNFLNKNPRVTPFVNNRPGKGWLKGFLKRHPTISVRTPEAVTNASACVSEQDIRNWFSSVSDELKKCNLEHILNDPSRIFNADESGFQTCPSSGRVFAQKGEKNVYVVDKGKTKENVTVLFTISADGQWVLPTIVYPYQRLPDRIRQTVPEDWGKVTSSSGWMTADTFKYIIEKVFYPFLVKNNIQLPILLFVDGHRSHLTYELSLLAHSLQIEIFALYPNATRILQPADVSLFRPVKQFWKTAVREWLLENEGEVVSKQNFALVLKKVTEKISPACIINGFRACGLFPFDANAVDYSKCIAKSASTKETTDSPILNDKLLPFSTFKEIVGSEMIDKFKNIQNILQDVRNNESFFTLYRLWEFYKTNPNFSEDTTINENEQFENVAPQSEITDDIQLKENVNANNVSINEEGLLNNILEYDEQQEDQYPGQIDLNEPNGSTSKHQTHMIQNSTNSFDQDEENGETEELITVEDLNLDQPLTSSKTNLIDFLPIPKCPARKGKRNIERLPYHISGLEYQKILENKAEEKRKQEEEKKQKKIAREQKKEDKKRKLEELKTKNLEKKKKSEFSSTCGVCKGIVKCIKLRCCECTKVFHKSCIPKAHAVHIPQEETDIFLCHQCFQLDSDDSFSEESDQENDDFLNMIKKGEEDIGLRHVKF